MKAQKTLKQKRCRQCKELFTPWNSLHVCCVGRCAIAYTKHKQETHITREIKASEKIKRAEIRKRKEKLKSRSDWLRDAQTVFNKFIRLRDEHIGLCISCQKPPKKKNAGHYKSRGAFPELRFNEDNCHLQCEHCNTYLSGNQINYRINLINKIGIERVDKLEGDNCAKKYNIEQIKEIKRIYSQKCKELSR